MTAPASVKQAIKCRHCGFYNAPGRKQCEECGGLLAPGMPREHIVDEFSGRAANEPIEHFSDYLHDRRLLPGKTLQQQVHEKVLRARSRIARIGRRWRPHRHRQQA